MRSVSSMLSRSVTPSAAAMTVAVVQGDAVGGEYLVVRRVLAGQPFGQVAADRLGQGPTGDLLTLVRLPTRTRRGSGAATGCLRRCCRTCAYL
jgi:hypothetical protein